MRISAIQKDTLFLLYAFEKNKRSLVRQTAMLKMISSQKKEVFPNNYSASCRTLKKNGLVNIERDDSLFLWLSLTNSGRELARNIYEERTAHED